MKTILYIIIVLCAKVSLGQHHPIAKANISQFYFSNMISFPSNENELYKYIENHIEYPDVNKKISDTIWVKLSYYSGEIRFETITEYHSESNKYDANTDTAYTNEAIRVVKSAFKWTGKYLRKPWEVDFYTVDKNPLMSSNNSVEYKIDIPVCFEFKKRK